MKEELMVEIFPIPVTISVHFFPARVLKTTATREQSDLPLWSGGGVEQQAWISFSESAAKSEFYVFLNIEQDLNSWLNEWTYANCLCLWRVSDTFWLIGSLVSDSANPTFNLCTSLKYKLTFITQCNQRDADRIFNPPPERCWLCIQQYCISSTSD